jgi:hypothetical protein
VNCLLLCYDVALELCVQLRLLNSLTSHVPANTGMKLTGALRIVLHSSAVPQFLLLYFVCTCFWPTAGMQTHTGMKLTGAVMWFSFLVQPLPGLRAAIR